MHVSVPPLVEVMQGELITLDCTPREHAEHYVLEWFLIATCNSRNGNPVPRITWYRNGQRLDVPMEVTEKGYMTSRTVREASGLYSLTSTLYLRIYKEDRDASFHCASHYKLPSGQHGRLDSPNFQLTLH
ncbi:hypothetical protein A6R68_07295, partial [Neotoma lepida]